MQPIYRQVLAIIFSLISIVIACNKCQQRNAREQWSPELEKQLTANFYEQASMLTKDENLKQQYADCYLSKIKELYPNGISSIGSEMPDTMKAKIMKMASDCVKIITRTTMWDAESEQQLNLRLYSLPEVKLLPEKMKSEYVNCVTSKIVAKFQHGLENDSAKAKYQTFTKNAREDCIKLLSNKYSTFKKPKF